MAESQPDLDIPTLQPLNCLCWLIHNPHSFIWYNINHWEIYLVAILIVEGIYRRATMISKAPSIAARNKALPGCQAASINPYSLYEAIKFCLKNVWKEPVCSGRIMTAINVPAGSRGAGAADLETKRNPSYGETMPMLRWDHANACKEKTSSAYERVQRQTCLYLWKPVKYLVT